MCAMATKTADRYQSVHEFQDALREYQSHSESILLTDSAEKNLHSAEATDDYELFSRALYGFEEALSMWDGNQRAKRLLAGTRLTYAGAAKKRDDFDLGCPCSTLRTNNTSRCSSSCRPVRGNAIPACGGWPCSNAWLPRCCWPWRASCPSPLLLSAPNATKPSNSEIRAVIAEDIAQKNYEAAEAARRVADTERQRAEAEEAKAVEAEHEAIAAKEAEEYEAYVARIGLANAKIEENAFDRAATLLDECNPELKDWEWGRLGLSVQFERQDLAGCGTGRVGRVLSRWATVRQRRSRWQSTHLESRIRRCAA